MSRRPPITWPLWPLLLIIVAACVLSPIAAVLLADRAGQYLLKGH